MKRFLFLLAFSSALLLSLSRCSGSADTYENRKKLAKEIIKSDCSGLGDMVIAYVKEKGDFDTDNFWGKAGEMGVRFLISTECNCMSEAVADNLAKSYTLEELEALKGKPLQEITQLPSAIIASYAEIQSCFTL